MHWKHVTLGIPGSVSSPVCEENWPELTYEDLIQIARPLDGLLLNFCDPAPSFILFPLHAIEGPQVPQPSQEPRIPEGKMESQDGIGWTWEKTTNHLGLEL